METLSLKNTITSILSVYNNLNENQVNKLIEATNLISGVSLISINGYSSDKSNNTEIANLGIRPSDNFIKTQLVLAMSQGVTLTLCRDDFMTLADKVINELFHTHMIL